MLRKTLTRRFFGFSSGGGNSGGFTGGFSSGFSKGFGGGGGAPSSSGPSGSSGLFGGFPGGNPFGGLMDKALEMCSTSHAYDIARQEGIDVRDIKFTTTPEGAVQVMVDAPNATPLQIEQLGNRVQEECPVARMRKTQVSEKQAMKWMRLPDPYDR